MSPFISKEIYIFCFVFFSVATSIAQQEYVISSPKEIIQYLHEYEQFTFSYPADLDEINGVSALLKTPSDHESLVNLFQKYNCDIAFLSEKHVLIRPSLRKETADVLEIKVLDAKNGQGLEWAAITLPERNEVYFTNKEGKATIKKGDKMEISLIGYETQSIQNQGDVEVATIKLKPRPVALGTVEKQEKSIAVSNDEGGNTKINYTFPYAMRSAGIGGKDVFATIQNLPGIESASEETGKLKVRGSNADETLILVDGLPVIQNSHYYDIFGTINPLFIDQFAVYKNQFPVEYSSRTGGMVSFTGETVKNQAFDAQIDVNFFTAGAMVSLPIAKNLSFIGAARTTYRNISNNNFYALNKFNFKNYTENLSSQGGVANAVQSSPDFSFADQNLKLRYDNGKTIIQASYLHISDKFENTIKFDVPGPGATIGEERILHRFSNDRIWSSMTSGFTIDHQIGTNKLLHASAYVADFKDDYNFDVLLSGGPRFKFIDNSNTYASDVSRKGFMTYFKTDFKGKNSFKIGYDLEVVNNQNKIENDRNQNFVSLNRGGIHSIFSDLSFNLNKEKTTISFGSRLSKVDNYFKVYPNLQMNFVHHVNSNFTLKSTLSKNHQLHRRIDVRDIFDQSLALWTLTSEGIPALSSLNFSAGFLFKKNQWLADLEIYHKSLDGVAEFANPRPGLRQNEPSVMERLRLFSGKGTSKGLDVLMRYEGTAFSSQVAYTWSKLIYEIPGIFRGQPYYAPSDRRHQLKWLNDYDFGKFILHFGANIASGQPYLVGEVIGENTSIGDLASSNLKRLPHYARVDLGCSYQFELNKIKNSLSFQIYNLGNRQNIKQIHYLSELKNPRLPTQGVIVGTITNMLNRTINLSWNVQF